MKTFKKMAAQGDVMFIRVDKLPYGLEKVNPINDHHVVAHSETGHHHTIEAEHTSFYKTGDDLLSYFSVDVPTPIIHERAFDTHEPIMIPVGDYMVRRQREYTARGFRKVQD